MFSRSAQQLPAPPVPQIPNCCTSLPSLAVLSVCPTAPAGTSASSHSLSLSAPYALSQARQPAKPRCYSPMKKTRLYKAPFHSGLVFLPALLLPISWRLRSGCGGTGAERPTLPSIQSQKPYRRAQSLPIVRADILGSFRTPKKASIKANKGESLF